MPTYSVSHSIATRCLCWTLNGAKRKHQRGEVILLLLIPGLRELQNPFPPPKKKENLFSRLLYTCNLVVQRCRELFRFSVVKPNQSNQSGQSEAWENHNEPMRNRRKTVGNERNHELPSHDWLQVRF